ncbi:MAG: hypothetical protein ACO3AG_00805 [Fluviibacter sp.]
MVIVLTGMQAINKKFLARIILASINKFEHSGFTADFTSSNFSIYDQDGTEVYRVATDTDAGIDTLIHSHKNGPSIIQYFDKLNTDVFEDIVKHSHFVNRFSSIAVDFGITNRPNYLKDNVTNKLLHPHGFIDVVELIKNYPYEHKVITGTVGAHFINRLKKALPNEEVHVVNIIRNPSASWLMNKKPESKWNSPGSPDLDEALDHERFFQSAIASAHLIGNPDVQTIRFEDMMHTGELKIGDTVIKVRDDYRTSNYWISEYEANNNVLMSDEEFASFNDRALHYTFEDFYVEPDDADEEEVFGMPRAELLEKIAQHFPRNLFAELGYEPLTKEEILAK